MIRVLLYTWGLPVTLLGWLAVLVCKRTGRSRWVNGVYEVGVEKLPWPVPSDMGGLALGGVILYEWMPEEPAPDSHPNSALFVLHERRHTEQAAVLGPFMLLLYPLLSLATWIKFGKDWHKFHTLEDDARAAAERRWKEMREQ